MATPKDQALNGVVVGMKALTGEVKQRVDIDVLLMKQPDTFNLMLQAISQMQKDNKKLGFFGLSGIHGLPNASWDDVKNRWNNTAGGYCAHGVLTFPTWHRPYLALFEQTIYLKMVDIANTYNQPHRERYLSACKEFRLPYMDYFRPRGGKVEFPGVVNGRQGTTSFPYDFRLPDIFNVQKVTIRVAPNDELDVNFDNPLYTYRFTDAGGKLSQEDRDTLTRQYSQKLTVRRPVNLSSETHDTKALSDTLNSGRQSRTTMMIKLLNSPLYAQLKTVATDAFLEEGDMTDVKGVFQPTRDNPQGVGNLEGTIHGNYHVLIGGNGVMSNPEVAAFDPVFWFHHCNIDRYWSIWAANHPTAWFPPPAKTSDLAENKKDLLPFYVKRDGAGKGTFYTSDNCKTTEAFGYYYDDFEGPANKVWDRFTAKYEWSTRTVLDPNTVKPPANMAPLPVQSTQFFQKDPVQIAAAATTVFSSMTAAAAPIMMQAQEVLQEITPAVLQATPARVDPKFNREWYIDSKVLRAASNGAFTIYFFLAKAGEIDEDTNSFAVSPFLAGFNHIFTAPREACDNCGNLEAAGQLATDTSLITPLLLDYLNLPDNGLESLRPEHVKPFLIKYLRWRVVYRGNSLHDPRDVPELKIGVSAEYYHEDGTKEYEDYPDVVTTILANASNSPTATA